MSEPRYVTHSEFVRFSTDLASRMDQIADKIDKRLSSYEPRINALEGETYAFKQTRGSMALRDIATAISVAVALVTVIGSLALGPIRFATISNRDDLKEHMKEPGHREAMELHATYAEKFGRVDDALDERLQDIEGHESRLRTIESTRFTYDKGEDLLERVTRLEAALESHPPLTGPAPR